jgi:glutathione-regulated potassium-efflux system ancillary protein KefG
MARVLLLFAHPALEKSRVHRRLLARLPSSPAITLNDLYEHYPRFEIDVEREKALLVEHDLVLLQHPFYWYSTPAMLKQWQDLVLEHGWAYGAGGTALHGKHLTNVVTTGGGAAAYGPDGLNRYTVSELLRPIEQTARLCGMNYLPPYLIQGTHRLTEADLDRHADHYARTLAALAADEIDLDSWRRAERLDGLVNADERQDGEPR